jgi:hypothetical protein
LLEGREPLRLISIVFFLLVVSARGGGSARLERAVAIKTRLPAPASRLRRVTAGSI